MVTLGSILAWPGLTLAAQPGTLGRMDRGPFSHEEMGAVGRWGSAEREIIRDESSDKEGCKKMGRERE